MTYNSRSLILHSRPRSWVQIHSNKRAHWLKDSKINQTRRSDSGQCQLGHSGRGSDLSFLWEKPPQFGKGTVWSCNIPLEFCSAHFRDWVEIRKSRNRTLNGLSITCLRWSPRPSPPFSSSSSSFFWESSSNSPSFQTLGTTLPPQITQVEKHAPTRHWVNVVHCSPLVLQPCCIFHRQFYPTRTSPRLRRRVAPVSFPAW